MTDPTTVSLVGLRPDSPLAGYQIAAEVAACRSMSEAAWNLDLDVSVVSRQIAALEKTLDCVLFERHRRGVRLTAAGVVFAQHMNGVLRAESAVRQELADLRNLRRGTLRIISTDGAVASPLGDAIASFSSKFPGINFELYRMSSELIVPGLREGRAELGAGLNLGQETGVEMLARYQDKLAAVMAPNHPLAKSRTVTANDVRHYPIASCERNSGIGRVLQTLPGRGADALPLTLVTNSLEAIKRFCSNGNGISILCVHSVQHEIESGDLIAIPLDCGGPLAMELDICTPAGASRSFALSEFIQHLTLHHGFAAAKD